MTPLKIKNKIHGFQFGLDWTSFFLGDVTRVFQFIAFHFISRSHWKMEVLSQMIILKRFWSSSSSCSMSAVVGIKSRACWCKFSWGACCFCYFVWALETIMTTNFFILWSLDRITCSVINVYSFSYHPDIESAGVLN